MDKYLPYCDICKKTYNYHEKHFSKPEHIKNFNNEINKNKKYLKL